jgi:hypothetical protein
MRSQPQHFHPKLHSDQLQQAREEGHSQGSELAGFMRRGKGTLLHVPTIWSFLYSSTRKMTH